LTSGEISRTEFIDEAGVKVTVRSAVTSGENNSVESVDNAGIVAKGVGLVPVQATRRVVRLNKAKPDRISLK
jgi:hypothetical protein